MSDRVREKGEKKPSKVRRPARVRPAVENLEDRTVPAMLDLTAAGAPGGVFNGARFSQTSIQPTGTGVIDSFVRIHQHGPSGMEQGYNTDGTLEFDTMASSHTHGLLLANVPLVEIDGVWYREFLLDINQNHDHPLLSLDQLRLFVGGSGDLSGYDLGTNQLAGLDAVYDMDAGDDNWVALNAELNHGSGSGDMFLYVPDSDFADGDGYVYLYSRFGDQEGYAGNGGFEEWAAPQPDADPTYSVSGYKFYDANHNGFWDQGEQAIAGWQFFLDDGSGGQQSATTDADGHFSFEGLKAGTYTVTENLDSFGVGHWQVTTPGSGSIQVAVGPNSATDVDFGNVLTFNVSGSKFYDANHNGAWDAGESGIAGWTVWIDVNHNGAMDAGESTTTDASGAYSFTGLYAGNYTVYEKIDSLPGHWQATTAASQTVAFSDADIHNPTADASGIDFGNVLTFKVSGSKFYDTNTNGSWDAGEKGVAGWTVWIDVNHNGTMDAGESTTTDVNGAYSFAGLYAGTYSVHEKMDSLPGTWIATAATSCGVSFSDADCHNPTSDVAGVNFFNVKLGAGNGLTLGWWSNKNGQAILQAHDPAWRNELNALNLRNANGTLFKVSLSASFSSAYGSFRSWLLSANSTNAAYMLSAQLITMKFNVRYGNGTTTADPNAMLYAPELLPYAGSTPGLNAAGFISVADLMSVANTRLGIQGTTTGASWERSFQVTIQSVLNKANNNLNFVASI